MKWDDKNDFKVSPSGVEHDPGLNFIRPFLTAMWAQRWIVVACTLLMTCLGVLYLLQRPPSYTARGLLLVENTTLEASRQELLPQVSSVDTSTVDSQVEIIRADAVTLKAMEGLGLAENRQSEKTAAPGLLAHVQNLLPLSILRDGGASQAPQEQTSQMDLPEFTSRLSIKRIGLSSVIEVGYTDRDPEWAARVVNKVIEAYLANQAASAAAAAASASAWLRDRIKDIGPRTRVVSLANPPVRKDGPRRLFLLGAFSAAGLLLGVGIAVTRYALDTTLRDPLQAIAKLGVTFLGAVARFPRSRKSSKKMRLSPGRRVDLHGSDVTALVGRIKVAISARAAGPIIGVTSITPGEGTTTLAADLAFSAAAAGLRVLLVDSNIYEPDLSSQLSPGAEHGLADVLAGRTSLNEACLETRMLGLHFLPAGSGAPPTHPNLDRSHVKPIVQKWADEYDLVLIDMPPLALVPDLGLARNMVDTFILVVEWGHVPVALAESALAAAGLGSENLLGFVFNKVRRSTINRFTFPLENFRWRRTGTDYIAQREKKGAPPEAPTGFHRKAFSGTHEGTEEYLKLASRSELSSVPRT